MGGMRAVIDVARPTILSLFSGVGGLELGVEIAMPRAHVVCGVEFNAYRAGVFASSFGCPVWDDIRTFDGTEWLGVTMVTAGFPCQAFSTAARGRNRESRNLWPEAARVISEAKPEHVFLENVWAIGAYLQVVRDDLRRMGYCVLPPLFTNSAALGAPHSRRRVWVLAYADSDGERAVSLDEEVAGLREVDFVGWWEDPGDRLLGMADGIPAGMVSRRALGDAVVPCQAAAAFAELVWRLSEV